MRKLLLAPLLLAAGRLSEQDGDRPRRCKDHRDHDDDVDHPADHDDHSRFRPKRSSPSRRSRRKSCQVVNFNGSTSVGGTDADGPHTIVSYAWDFGDGDPPKTGVTSTHDFVKTGIYLVTLTS